jgi:hypothetical protein
MGVLANGQIIPDAPALYRPPTQQVSGSLIEAAASKTLASNAAAAEAAQKLGAGQKGAGRRRRRRSHKVKKGGAQTMNASIPNLPTANSIPGVSHVQNHLDAVDHLNDIKAGAMFDSTLNAAPVNVGGRRKRSRKAKNGRRHNRTHRRGNSKSTHRHRRSRRAV